ncbi:MAG TPA: deAMPylase SidD family protein [Gammaproteobacteria bacterium]|nr:deAMPylase SidD family protein [Gammaproteobacteria bacterium]
MRKTLEQLQNENFYERLGLQRDATLVQIKKAYKTMALMYHPDHSKDDSKAGLKFGLIHDAYSALIDTEQREIYDNLLKNNLGSNFSSQSNYEKTKAFPYVKPKEGFPKYTQISQNFVVTTNQHGIDLFFNRTGEHVRHFDRQIPSRLPPGESNPEASYYYKSVQVDGKTIYIARRDFEYSSATVLEKDNLILATHERTGDIDVFDIETGLCVRRYEEIRNGFYHAKIISHGKDFIFLLENGTISKLSMDGTYKYFGSISDYVGDILLSDNGKYMVITYRGDSARIEIINTETGAQIFKSKSSRSTPLLGASLSPDDRYIAYFVEKGDRCDLLIHDILNGRQKKISTTMDVASFSINMNVRDICFSPCGGFIVLACGGLGYAFYSIQENKIIMRGNLEDDISINKVSFTNDRLILETDRGIYNAPIPNEIRPTQSLEKEQKETDTLFLKMFYEEEKKESPSVKIKEQPGQQSELSSSLPGILHQSREKQLKCLMTGTLITQFVEGAVGEMGFQGEPTALDAENSIVSSNNLFRRYGDGKQIIFKNEKVSDDKIVIGYSRGLPFLIVADGMLFRCNRDSVFSFIDQAVTPLMNEYAEKLSKTKDDIEAQAVIKNLIQAIYIARAMDKNSGIDLTMSLAISFERNGKLYCAGFGIGDTGILRKKADGSIDHLVYTSHFNESDKDAFNDETAKMLTEKGIDNLIARNSMFITEIEEGDEIVGYTFLTDSLLKEVSHDVSGNEEKSNLGNPIYKSQLNNDVLPGINPDQLLYNVLKSTNEKLFNQDFEKKAKNSIGDLDRLKRPNQYNYGDDCSFGTFRIPSPKLRKQLAQAQCDFTVRTERPNNEIAVTGINLNEEKLEGIKNRGANLHKATAMNAFFNDCHIAESNLTHVNFKNAKFNHCFLARTNMSSMKSTGQISTDFSNTKFNVCDLTSVNATGVNFKNASFENSVLNNILFVDADLEEATFDGAILNNANLQGAKFKASQFSTEQIRTFYYGDEGSLTKSYVDTLCQYIDDNKSSKERASGVNRAQSLLTALIFNPNLSTNTYFNYFMHNGKLKNEWSMSSSDQNKKGSLLNLLNTAKQSNVKSVNNRKATH